MVSGESGGKSYDRQYFDRWYRDPEERVGSRASLGRKVALALAVAEALLERRVRTVLDVGCGEARWQPVLDRLRPGLRYQGVDPSPYAAGRYGKHRNVLRGRADGLDALGLPGPWDLVVCCDVLHYLDDGEAREALRGISARLGGVAYLEAFTAEDDVVGDLEGFHARPASWYVSAARRLFLTPVGMHCWVAPALAARATALETAVGWRGRR